MNYANHMILDIKLPITKLGAKAHVCRLFVEHI
jgi:hypothetical protein